MCVCECVSVSVCECVCVCVCVSVFKQCTHMRYSGPAPHQVVSVMSQ